MEPRYRIGSLFSGLGGLEAGLEMGIAGAETIWQVESNEFCRGILRRHWPSASLYDDVCTVGAHNLASIDILCGGFPCQGFSRAGKMGGLEDERSGLWWEMWRIIGELRPRVVVLENVSALLIWGLREVLGSLAELRYDAEWCVVSASQFGAPHKRDRLFVVCYPSGSSAEGRAAANGDNLYTVNAVQAGGSSSVVYAAEDGRSYWDKTETPPRLCGVDDGVSARVDRCKALGNSVVPQCGKWVGEQIVKAGIL